MLCANIQGGSSSSDGDAHDIGIPTEQFDRHIRNTIIGEWRLISTCTQSQFLIFM